MLDLFFLAFVLALFGLGLRRPFVFVLAYAYIDIVAPQKISWGVLAHIPISLLAFIGAFVAWALADNKEGPRFSARQALLVLLLVYCFLTTQTALFPDEAADKWSWVWKALVFATFLPLTLRTRLRFEALALTMVLSVSVIVIGGAIKTLASGGGGYGELKLLVNDNTGLYEGSIISMVAIAVVPVIVWLMRHGTIFPRGKLVTLYGLALIFACVLIPIGTQTRTGFLCILLVAALALRDTQRRFTWLAIAVVAGLVALPLLPKSYVARIGTIENHQADQSASTRVAVWKWTWDYVKDHPFGGGFEVYRANTLRYDTVATDVSGSNVDVERKQVEEKARAFHSSYFEMLGEQGWPGFLTWLALQLSGLWQMERVRARWRTRKGAVPEPGTAWIAPLASALQQAQLVYMTGSLFVGIAFQPFIYMLIGLQIGLNTYAARLGALRFVPRPPARVRRADEGSVTAAPAG